MRCVAKDLLRAAEARLLLAGIGMLTLLAACGQENRFIPPPPPKVTVQFPLQQTFTPYLQATGNAASVNTVKLVARVQGYVQEIKYQDGAAVKKGTPLFVIEPEPYKVQLEQAQAAEEGAKATLVNAEAEFTRQEQLQAKDVSTQANLDKARAARDTARATVLQTQAQTQTAEINLGYTTVSAPFDGVVTARKVSVGELVGDDHTSELATIVQLDPIWVWFNLSEQDVQRVRVQMAQRAVTVADLINKVPIEVGLQTETGYPHKGVLDYSSPDVNQSTGTLQVRGIFQNPAPALLPGYFVRVRVPLRTEQALLVPEVAVGSDQAGRYPDGPSRCRLFHDSHGQTSAFPYVLRYRQTRLSAPIQRSQFIGNLAQCDWQRLSNADNCDAVIRWSRARTRLQAIACNV